MKYLFLLLLISGHCLSQENKLIIERLAGDLYIYQTFHEYEGDRISANGMYLLTKDGAVLFDTPWDTTQFQPLLDSIWIRHRSLVTMCLVTHFHEDRTAGLEYYKNRHILTYSTKMTDDLSKAHKMKRSEYIMPLDNTFSVGQYSFETFYPGPGHSQDNIVIWFPKDKVLYGGCFVKCSEANDLGNLSDANPVAWKRSMMKLIAKYNNWKYVIPGHHHWKDRSSPTHTLRLIENHLQGK